MIKNYFLGFKSADFKFFDTEPLEYTCKLLKQHPFNNILSGATNLDLMKQEIVSSNGIS